MNYYHVRISLKGQDHDEVKTDMDGEALERQFLAPYRAGEMVTMNGKTFDWEQVERIRVSTSDQPAAAIIEQIKAADRTARVVSLGGPGYSWRAAARAEDVTDQYVTGPPGQALTLLSEAVALVQEQNESGQTAGGDPGGVFVVAGRDGKAISALTEFLRALGLRVIEWEHAVAKTGLPNPYVGDVVVEGLRMAGAAVVLLTPDDRVQLREDLLRDDDGPEEREVRGQARPNVYYEAGIADAIGRERTVIVELGSLKSFSDAAGRHVVRYDGTPGRRQALASRLAVAGLHVDTSGQDWLSVGNVAELLEEQRGESDARRHEPTTSQRELRPQQVLSQVDLLLTRHADMVARSAYDDLSDLEPESLDLVFQSQALLDRLGPSPYRDETDRYRTREPHERIPVLVAALRGVRGELE